MLVARRGLAGGTSKDKQCTRKRAFTALHRTNTPRILEARRLRRPESFGVRSGTSVYVSFPVGVCLSFRLRRMRTVPYGALPGQFRRRVQASGVLLKPARRVR